MSTFDTFARVVRAQFQEMEQAELFVVDADRDVIWEKYLMAFPAGTNPMFRERTEHDCSCCRHFIRDMGPVVALQNGVLTSIWDLAGLPEHYQVVANAMSAYVKSLPIRDIYVTDYTTHGTEQNHEAPSHLTGPVLTWKHFSVKVGGKFVHLHGLDERRGEARTSRDVLYRGLTELKSEALETVLDLIDSKALYRGEEHKRAVAAFYGLQDKFLRATSEQRQLFAWANAHLPVARFRNTVIGTLVQDLSDGKDLEHAVKSFETKVAPQNYKRPTALITKGMVEQAMKTIGELGLEEALQRRHATFSDVSVNSVLFVDRGVRGKMKGGLTEMLMQDVKQTATFNFDKAEEIAIDKFVREVLPKTTELKLYMDNALLQNFMSLTAPVNEDSKSLFKWANDFAWSYDGNVTDSIKERVKRAGGQVENVKMRASLAWSNYDDLDLHVHEPDGTHIYFGNRGGHDRNGRKCGVLDVDMNAGGGTTREPVENIRWTDKLKDGQYQVRVNQFSKRESIRVGFTVEIESDLGLQTFTHVTAVRSTETVTVAILTVKGGNVIDIKVPSKEVVAGQISTDKWGIKTLDLVKVNSLVLSPNYWDDNAVGNKHWFFILDGCKNPEPARGIYNEFLSSKLDKHRKVFEVLGDRTKCLPEDSQMSGVGFSSTRKEKVTVMAVGPRLSRPYTIVF